MDIFCFHVVTVGEGMLLLQAVVHVLCVGFRWPYFVVSFCNIIDFLSQNVVLSNSYSSYLFSKLSSKFIVTCVI